MLFGEIINFDLPYGRSHLVLVASWTWNFFVIEVLSSDVSWEYNSVKKSGDYKGRKPPNFRVTLF